MTWQPGDRVSVRGASCEIVRVMKFADCEALDFAPGPPLPRTLLVPFDRPRRQPRARLRIVSRRRLVHQTADLLRSTFPHGGLRFCPRGIRLLPYQLEPALASLRHGALRILLGDDVGLGKTVEAGLIVNEVVRGARLSRVLIVCPASIRHQWRQELAALFELDAIDADAAWLRRTEFAMPEEVNPWSLPGVYLASLDFMKRAEALQRLEEVLWDLLVVDEAHAAAPGTDRLAAVHAIARRSRRLLLLTATPHSGSDDGFSSLCGLGAGDDEAPVVFFRRSREEVMPCAIRPRTVLLPIRPTEDERRMHAMLEAYAARVWREARGRSDSAGQLVAAILHKRALSSAASLARSLGRRIELLQGQPPAAAQLWLPLDEEDAVEGDQVGDAEIGARGLNDSDAERAMLGSMLETAARGARHESKVAAVLRLLRRVREPAVLFTEYRDTAEHLERCIRAAGHQVCLLHGGLPRRLRVEVLKRFAAGGWILVATDAASEGLNLHWSCRLIVHFELPWSPSRLRQRAGRVHRIGQTQRVHEIALLADHTCERFVLAPLAARSLASAGFSGDSLVDRLPESKVAAHVLGAVPLVAGAREDRKSPGVVRRLDLSGEAAVEAERLEALRRLDARRAPRRALPRPRQCVPVAILPCGWGGLQGAATLVAVVTLREPGGAVLEHTALLLAVHAPGLTWPRARAAVRQALEAMLAALAPALSRLAADVAGARMRGLEAVRTRAAAELRRREQERRRQAGTAARELVQGGLFDRRAWRKASARARAAALLEDEPAAAEGSGSSACEACFDVRAVFLRGPG